MFNPEDINNKNLLNEFGKGVGQNLGWKSGRARASFVATGGLATGTYNLVGADGVTPLTFPNGTTITRVVYKNLTTFASATSAATIALQIVSANDVVSAVAISNGSAPWTAADLPIVGVPVGGTLATWLTVKTNAGATAKAVVGVEALTAGKLVAFFDWLYWGDLGVT